MSGELSTVAVLKIADKTNVLTDVSQYLNQCGLTNSIDQVESTTFGATRKQYTLGLEDGTIALGGPADPVIDGVLDGIRRLGDRSYEFYPFGDSGAAGTNVKYAGVANLSKYNLTPGAPGDIVKFDAEMQQSGDVVRSLV